MPYACQMCIVPSCACVRVNVRLNVSAYVHAYVSRAYVQASVLARAKCASPCTRVLMVHACLYVCPCLCVSVPV